MFYLLLISFCFSRRFSSYYEKFKQTFFLVLGFLLGDGVGRWLSLLSDIVKLFIKIFHFSTLFQMFKPNYYFEISSYLFQFCFDRLIQEHCMLLS